ncbi:hypothetical protein C8J57DRAFT_1628607 [Mycena rebaudengoi]|nr:hypothetical protein C8J57DRAFT_1628607 [Mycena rebaudengoi]
MRIIFDYFVPRLERRKAGGASGSKGGVSGGTKSGGGGGGSNKGGLSVASGDGSKTARASGFGGGTTSQIPAGHPFAGRAAGGGKRDQVLGGSYYGSGYPAGYPGYSPVPGVYNSGFPFYYWPVVWGDSNSNTHGQDAGYLYPNEYGSPNNASRPGGLLVVLPLKSNGTDGNVFRVLSDNSTIYSLATSINGTCTTILADAIVPFTPPAAPGPEQVVQYYRASSVSLSIDAYNNTAAFQRVNTTAAAPLPSGLEKDFFECLNRTIISTVPLFDGASSQQFSPTLLCFIVIATLFGLTRIH